MPFCAARMISGSAARRACAAAARSPPAIASSTWRMKVRIRLRRDRLIAVRLAILRVIFLADVVLAMGYPRAYAIKIGGGRLWIGFKRGKTGKTAGHGPRGLARAGL